MEILLLLIMTENLQFHQKILIIIQIKLEYDKIKNIIILKIKM